MCPRFFAVVPGPPMACFAIATSTAMPPASALIGKVTAWSAKRAMLRRHETRVTSCPNHRTGDLACRIRVVVRPRRCGREPDLRLAAGGVRHRRAAAVVGRGRCVRFGMARTDPSLIHHTAWPWSLSLSFIGSSFSAIRPRCGHPPMRPRWRASARNQAENKGATDRCSLSRPSVNMPGAGMKNPARGGVVAGSARAA